MRKRLIHAILGWLLAIGIALMLRWLYAVWPNRLTGLLAPVSQSPWEWGKAAYWPGLAALLLMRWMNPDDRPQGAGWWLLTILPLATCGICWALQTAELPVFWVWPTVLAAGLLLDTLLRRRGPRGTALLPLTVAVLLGIAYILLTVLPPMGGPFTDPSDVSAMATIPY